MHARARTPRKKEVKIGFIPLTDCASVVMASVLGFDKKYGVTIIPTKEAIVGRRARQAGQRRAGLCPRALRPGLRRAPGHRGPKKDMAVLMNLNNNGQAITLSKALADKGRSGRPNARQADGQRKTRIHLRGHLPHRHPRDVDALLAGGGGINPLSGAKVITVPPPQMVANMRVGNMDGFCVGEPWNHRAIMDGIGITANTTQDIWKDHPEKVLGTTAEFVKKNPNTTRAVMMAVLEASQWIDASLSNKMKMAETVAGQGLRQHQRGRDQPAHPGPLPERPGQDLGRPQPHEVLQRRRGELPLPVGRHVVPHAAQALGPAEGPSRLPGRGQADQPDRALQVRPPAP